MLHRGFSLGWQIQLFFYLIPSKCDLDMYFLRPQCDKNIVFVQCTVSSNGDISVDISHCKHQSNALLVLWVGNPPVNGRFSIQESSNAESIPMACRLHVGNNSQQGMAWYHLPRCVRVTREAGVMACFAYVVKRLNDFVEIVVIQVNLVLWERALFFLTISTGSNVTNGLGNISVSAFSSDALKLRSSTFEIWYMPMNCWPLRCQRV